MRGKKREVKGAKLKPLEYIKTLPLVCETINIQGKVLATLSHELYLKIAFPYNVADLRMYRYNTL